MPRTVFRNARLLDLEAGVVRPGSSVLVEDGTIREVAERDIAAGDAVALDAGGRVLMPGLIDCHVHVLASVVNLGVNAAQPNVLAAFHAIPILRGILHRGFTTIRDAGGADWSLAQAVERGLVEGPRIFPSGKALSQTGGHGDFRQRSDTLQPCACDFRIGSIARIVDGVDACRLAVREEMQKGATQIKIMASGGAASPIDPIANFGYSDDEMRAICAEADAWQSYVMAHAYTPKAISRAVANGVRTIEHGNLVDDDAARAMAARGVYAVPTLITYDALAEYGARLGFPAESVEKIKSVQGAGRTSLEIFRAAGVRMGYGTDLLGELHREQSHELVIRAEVLGTLPTLQSATTIAAEIVGMRGRLGVVAPGAIADLLLVDGDPLADITVLEGQGARIPLIMKEGRIVKRTLAS
jgi:imidazolonepropionase-like amidohydrolase